MEFPHDYSGQACAEAENENRQICVGVTSVGGPETNETHVYQSLNNRMDLKEGTESTLSSRPRRSARKRTSEYSDDVNSKKQKPMTQAERCKKWRENMKNDPEYYKLHRQYETARVKAIRKGLTEEQRMKYNQKSKERMKKYRERQKELGIIKPKKRKVLTRTETENLRKKWRLQKQKQRESMSSQKKRRINEQRRQKYEQKKQVKTDEHEGPVDKQVGFTSNGIGFSSNGAKRKAISRAKAGLPKNAKKFSVVVSSLISTATPTKKAELQKNLVYSPKSKRRLDMFKDASSNFKDNLKSLKRTKATMLQKRYMVHSLLKNAKTTKSREVALGFGFSPQFVRKVENLEDLESRKKRKDALSDTTTETVKDFFDRTDLVRTLPQNATKAGVKKVLECSMRTMYEEYKKDNEDLRISYSKFVSMKPKSIQPMSKQKFIACLCEYCVNMELKIEALQTLKKRQAHRGDHNIETSNVPTDKFSLAKMTTCEEATKKCIDRNCGNCGVHKIDEMLTELTNNDEKVSWLQWERTKYRNAYGKETIRMLKIPKEEEGQIFCEKLRVDLVPFSRHLLDAKWQSNQFSIISKNVPQNSVVICCDFAENFACQYQDEAQGAHWSYDQVTIHPVMCYYRCQKPECHQIVEESVLIISDDHTHDSHAVHHYTKIAIDNLKSKGIRIEKMIQFSDGAPSQFKGKTNFADLAFSSVDFDCQFEKHFFGTRHGKGPCDREIGTVKRSAVLAVKCRRREISNAKTFYDYCKESLDRPKDPNEHSHFVRTSKYISVGDVKRDRLERVSLRAVKNTRKYHCFRSVDNSATSKVIESRERSCFCLSCVGTSDLENCPNKDMTGEWIKNYLGERPRAKQNRTHMRSRRGSRSGRGRGRARCRGGRLRRRGRAVSSEPSCTSPSDVDEDTELEHGTHSTDNSEETDRINIPLDTPVRERGRCRGRGKRGRVRCRGGSLRCRGRAVKNASLGTAPSEIGDDTDMEYITGRQSTDQSEEETDKVDTSLTRGGGRRGKSSQDTTVDSFCESSDTELSPVISCQDTSPCPILDFNQNFDDCTLDISNIMQTLWNEEENETSFSELPTSATCDTLLLYDAPLRVTSEALASVTCEAPVTSESPASFTNDFPSPVTSGAEGSFISVAPVSVTSEIPATIISITPYPFTSDVQASFSGEVQASVTGGIPATVTNEVPVTSEAQVICAAHTSYTSNAEASVSNGIQVPVISEAPATSAAHTSYISNVAAPVTSEIPAPVTSEVPVAVTSEVQVPVTIEAPATSAAHTSYTSNVPASVTSEIPAPVTSEVPASVTNEIPAPVTSEVPVAVTNEISVPDTIEVPVAVTSEIPAPVTSEVPVAVTSEIPAPVASEVSVAVTSEIQVPITIEAPATSAAQTSYTSNVPASVTSEIPAPVTSEVPASVTSEIPAPVTSEVPASVTSEIPVAVISEISVPVTIEVPVAVTSEIPAPVTSEVPVVVTSEIQVPVTIEAPATSAAHTSYTSNVPASVTSEIPTPVTSEVPVAVTSETQFPHQDRFSTGTFISIRHGNIIYPAVVKKWPFVQYFHKKAKGKWVEGVVEHTIVPQDIVGELNVPEIHLMGSRIFYSFADLPSDEQ